MINMFPILFLNILNKIFLSMTGHYNTIFSGHKYNIRHANITFNDQLLLIHHHLLTSTNS